MAEPWIKLIIHPEHPKVLRLAELLRLSPEEAFAKMVRWFRYVDANLASGACAVGSASLCAICRFHPDRNKSQTEDTLVEAMVAVGWLGRGEAGGPLLIPEFDKHFGKSAKIRAQAADRQQALRDKRNDSNASSVTRNAVGATPFLSPSDSGLSLSQKQEDATPRDSAPIPRPLPASLDDPHGPDRDEAGHVADYFGIKAPESPLRAAVEAYCDAKGIPSGPTGRYRIHQEAEELAQPTSCDMPATLEGLEWGRANKFSWTKVKSHIRSTEVTGGWRERTKVSTGSAGDSGDRAKERRAKQSGREYIEDDAPIPTKRYGANNGGHG